MNKTTDKKYKLNKTREIYGKQTDSGLCGGEDEKSGGLFKGSATNIRAGKASTNILNGIQVDYYGSMMGIGQVASVTVPDAKTVLIQPWEKSMIGPIEKAIINANIGLTPSNNGEHIRLTMPVLTEEAPQAACKAGQGGEREGSRNPSLGTPRAVEAFKKAQKEGMPEDEAKTERQVRKNLRTNTPNWWTRLSPPKRKR